MKQIIYILYIKLKTKITSDFIKFYVNHPKIFSQSKSVMIKYTY